jgi:hypothetical protein
MQSLAQGSVANTAISARLQEIECCRRRFKAWKAEKRRTWRAGRGPVERHLDRRDAVLDLVCGFARLDLL